MRLVSGGEASLCERFGVSRTVVRESLRQRESESLITGPQGGHAALAPRTSMLCWPR
jgi:DNA-binding FadR family transcriptional regulator